MNLSAATNRLDYPVTYDSAGHLEHWNGYDYTYNDLGQLLTEGVDSNVNHTYLYTAAGERIADRNHLNNTTTLTLRNLDGHLLRTYLETGTSGNGAMSWVEDEVWGGGRLLGTISPTDGTRYYAVDQLGTPRLVCDRCKDRKAQHDYYAFGLEASDPTQDAEPTRFTSQETDLHNTSGQTDDLVNMRARFYHPLLARFLSADLLSGNPHSPQSFNLFSYVKGNPTDNWDPYGMKITLTRAGQIVVTANDPCREAPQGISCQTWWDILAAGGWASRNDFMSGTPPDWLNESGAGSGNQLGHLGYPTVGDYASWFWQSYYQDMLNRGIFYAGGQGFITDTLGGTLALQYAGGRTSPIVGLVAPIYGDSVFAGAGLRFGSLTGPLRSGVTITAADLLGVRAGYRADIYGHRQFFVQVGFGYGGSVSVMPVGLSL